MLEWKGITKLEYWNTGIGANENVECGSIKINLSRNKKVGMDGNEKNWNAGTLEYAGMGKLD